MHRSRVFGLVAGAATLVAVVAPIAGYRFALEYRRRAGFPAQRRPLQTPGSLGLPFEEIAIPSPAGTLPAWFVAAHGGAPGPAVVLVHGWESNRARMLPNAAFLNAAGFHTLMFDVRGHGENPPEWLPISAGEFGADTRAAVDVLALRPEVTAIGALGHSMGAAGAAVAAATDGRVRALVLTSTPADPRRLTRRTFQLAGLPIPGAVAQPLAWLTASVYLRPRGHAVADVSARHAVRRYPGPVLLIHGSADEVVPATHLGVLERAARQGVSRPVESLLIDGGYHRWLYEFPAYRSTIARFLARHLGGPFEPEDAAARAATMEVRRQPDTEGQLTALESPAESPIAR